MHGIQINSRHGIGNTETIVLNVFRLTGQATGAFIRYPYEWGQTPYVRVVLMRIPYSTVYNGFIVTVTDGSRGSEKERLATGDFIRYPYEWVQTPYVRVVLMRIPYSTVYSGFSGKR